MDIGLWLGIASLVLAIPLGIATNLLTPRLIGYLERQNLIIAYRTKKQELAQYRRIEAFANSTRDRYPFYLLLIGSALISSIALSTCLILMMLKFTVSNGNTVILPALIGIFFMVMIALMAAIGETARRIDRFDEYKAEIRAKWGDDAI
jgi:hypothetical protein